VKPSENGIANHLVHIAAMRLDDLHLHADHAIEKVDSLGRRPPFHETRKAAHVRVE
jgi:hypothetical protein